MASQEYDNTKSPWDDLHKRCTAMFTEQQPWRTLWDAIFELVVPERSMRFKSGMASDVAPHVWDSTAAESADNLANQMVSVLTPAGIPWLLLVPGPKYIGDDRIQKSQILQPLNSLISYHLQQSRFSVAVQPAFLDCMVTAGCLRIEPADDGQGVRVSHVPIDEIAYKRGRSGAIDTVVRVHRVYGYEIEQLWADKLNAEAKRDIAERRNELYEILQYVYPAETGGGFEYYDLFPQYRLVLTEKRIKRNPFIVFRWSEIDNSVYGRGPAMIKYHDIRTLNLLAQYQVKASAFDLLGVWAVEDDGVINPYTIRLVPGERIVVADATKSIRRLDGDGATRHQIGLETLNGLRESIRSAFYADKFSPIQGDKMSATEILARNQEMSQSLGAVWGRIEAELLRPVAEMFVGILRDQGAFEEFGSEVSQFMRLDRKELDVIFLGTIANAQRMQSAQGIVQFLSLAGGFAQVDPQTTILVDVSAAMRLVAEWMGVPAEVVRTQEQVNLITRAAQGMMAAGMNKEMGIENGAVPGPGPNGGGSQAPIPAENAQAGVPAGASAVPF